MGTMPPNHQKLILTNKNKGTPEDAIDKREMEMWANEGIVRSLHAGSGITLSPSTGVDTGTGITISSSGGGGGSSVGIFGLSAGPDSLTGTFLSPNLLTLAWPNYIPHYLLNPDGTILTGAAAVGAGWVAFIGASSPASNNSVNLLPILQAPDFTGAATISVDQLYMGAQSTDGVNQARYHFTSPFTMTSGENYQTVAADWTVDWNNGGDLTMTAGTGDTGNGLVSSAATATYLAGVWGEVLYTGATFT